MAADGARPQGLPIPQRYWSVLAIWLALTMAVLDGAIANVALPTIAQSLSATAADSIWVVNAYQLTILVALLPLAALGEFVGFRTIYLIGLAVFSLASLACALSDSLFALSAMRAIQGLGAAGIMSVNGALVRLTYPPRQLGRGIGLNALVVSMGAAFGPTVASGVLSVASWQWLFAINVPIGVAALLLGRYALPRNASAGRVDLGDAALNVLLFGLFFIGLDTLTRGGSASVGCVELLGCVLAGVVLFRRSLQHARPLIPLDLLRDGMFSLSVLTSVASYASQMLAFVSLPFFIQNMLHRDQVATGLLMTPWPLAVAVAAPLAGQLADRLSPALLGSLGLLVMALGLMALALFGDAASSAGLCVMMVACGFGFGFFQSPNNRVLLSSAPIERSGAAGGMLATARLTGQTSGATLAAILLRVAGASAETTALVWAAGFAAAAAVASLLRFQTRPRDARGAGL
jgi:DHA2 family multidrug resistance protein-like MFS transporter